MENGILVLQIFFPILAGVLMLCGWPKKESGHQPYITVVLLLSAGLTMYGVFAKTTSLTLFELTTTVRLTLCNDGLARLFCTLVAGVWLLVGVYSFRYLDHGGNTRGFYASFLMSLGVLQAVALSANLITFYMFYEWMTMLTFPLVLQTGTREAVRAAKKYFFFSITGACLCLAGIFLLSAQTEGLGFTGSLLAEADLSKVYLAALLLLFGFGTKAGMFPMHGWLIVAHPAAPAPASAVLSGLVTKVGVLGIIRTFYYVIGASALRGSYVQKVFLVVSLLTVFMGSMLAYKEKVLKKRLAYSTVSQVSYILFGLALMTPEGYAAALIHMAAHCVIKVALFLFAGTVIHETGQERVAELKGIGRRFPGTLWCFTIASLGLVGIPPTAGFVSKWYLATAAMDSEIPVFGYLGPAVLLISALLTAGYLLTITADGFFPGRDFEGIQSKREGQRKEGGLLLFVPLAVFAVLTVLLGIMAQPLYHVILQLVQMAPL